VIESLALVLALATGAAEEAKFSCEEAIVPSPASGLTLVQAEYQWLRNTFGGGSLVRQALGASSDGKRRYDLIVWRKPDGQTVEVCFDVTTVFEETIRKIEDGDPDRPPR
jgi:hypothetical protein